MTELRIVARCALLLASAVLCASAGAQAPAVASAASSAADRAQKESDRTLYWIRVLAEKPAAKPAAPKPVTAEVRAKPAAVAAESRPAERVKVASASTADSANAASSSVVTPAGNPAQAAVAVAPPAATAPAVPMPTGAAGNSAAMASSGGLDAGVSAPALAGALAAPTMTPPPVDIPAAAEVEEPDPGLIMIKSADPQFPMNTMRRLRRGSVEVKFEVGADGQVDVVSVVKTTNPGLNDAALEAVRQWRFKPTPKGHTALVDLAFDLDA
jgi:TonB family protein